MSELRDRILAADDRPYKDVEVEEWGATVRLRGLSGAAAERFSRKVQAAGENVPDDMMAELLALCLEDPESGDLVFAEEDIPSLSGKASTVLARLFREAQSVSGLGSLDEAKND